MTTPAPGATKASYRRLHAVAPGLSVCAIAVLAALAIGRLIPTVSVLLIAIVLGAVLRNLIRLPAVLDPGFKVAAKTLLRAGVVLLGLQLLLGDILGLGAGMILVVVGIVGIGILGTLLLGKWMGITPTQRLLIACGFSICGAAAVAAVDGVIETEDEQEVITAIALVVIFGTLMIPFIPFAAGLLGLSGQQGGMWAGGSIHEIAQVVAAGGALGGAALGVAVIVKLARILMLAPVMAVISIRRRRSMSGTDSTLRRPPVMPLFVLGFIVLMLIRSTGIIPGAVLDVAQVGQTALLAAAMFALGTGVHLKSLRTVGLKPFALAAASTVLVAGTSLIGILLVG
ncbi:putative sulfate exporter family transporter [Paeniglutamicibacter antarcticus]|uniref:Sulfate exporter family transporter n=1 Tax=Arthrobacter terrae TaxID=2935737 RepID=A0A931CKX3_9MICC|nr:putative sulfate exporter family transporter [Arthrobacter terrae]